MRRYYIQYFEELDEYAFMKNDKIVFTDRNPDVVHDVLDRYAEKLYADGVKGLVVWNDLDGVTRIQINGCDG